MATLTAALPLVRATRYIAPLREGGSLPALMETDDEGTYVVKFRGAGQGPLALVAEVLAGGIGRVLGLPIPDLVLVDLDPSFARLEPDPEIAALLRASEGVNAGIDFLPGSVMFDPLVPPRPTSELSSDVVWFDAFVTNVDRTARNPNLLVWHGDHWLIDHGASLYFQHDWRDDLARADAAFPQVRDHVLLPFATDLRAADERARAVLDGEALDEVLAAVPDAWLAGRFDDRAPADSRAAYRRFLLMRLERSTTFVEEALRARADLV